MILKLSREFVSIRAIGRLIWRAFFRQAASDTTRTQAYWEEAAFQGGFSIDASRAVREWRSKGRLKVFRIDGIAVASEDDVANGYLRRSDLVALMYEEWNTEVIDAVEAGELRAPQSQGTSAGPERARSGQGERTAHHPSSRSPDILTTLIRQALDDTGQSPNGNRAVVWTELERRARLPEESRPEPLRGVTSGGIQYVKGGRTMVLTRRAFGDRMRRLDGKGASRPS